MSDLKRIRAACFASFLAILAGIPAHATQDIPDQQLSFFASCAGRLSATMEHQWMFDGPGSETTERQRNAVVDILETMIPKGQGRAVLALRIEAKMAHAALLTRATFSTEPQDAKWALRTAERLTSDCKSFLLS